MAFSTMTNRAAGYIVKAATDWNVIISNFAAIWVGTTAGDTDYYTSATAKTRLPLGQQGLAYRAGTAAPEWGGYFGGKAIRTTNQNINNATDTDVVFTSTEFSQGVTWSGGDATKLTIGITSLYHVGAYFETDNAVGYRQADISKNGTTIMSTRMGDANGEVTRLTIGEPFLLTSGDYLKLTLNQNSGGAIAIRSARLWAIGV